MSNLSIKTKATDTVIHIPFRNSTETVQVTLFKKRFCKKSVPRFDREEPDEVEQGVRDWYAALGQPVPAADLAFMAAMKGLPVEEPVEPVATVVIDEMPEKGTPEFWAWCRRRRAAANAERAAKGLPPLPTAAQKAKAAAAAKAEKDAAKAAKDAAKAAKEAAKAAKDAAKAAKAAAK